MQNKIIINNEVSPLHPQDYGIACLCTVAATYHKYIAIPLLRQLQVTASNGTNLDDIARTAGKSGFKTDIRHLNARHLRHLHFPAIAQVMSGAAIHYVVLHGIRWKKVSLMEPPEKVIRRENIAHFERRWTGVILQLRPIPENNKRWGLFAIQTYLKAFWFRLRFYKYRNDVQSIRDDVWGRRE